LMLVLDRFEYFAPTSVREALTLAAKYGGRARYLAGGQSLLPLMKLGLASPEALIDLNRIEGLEYIKAEDEWIRIGAMTRHAAIASSSLLAERAPLMVEAANQIGDPQVRNMGTIGGSLAHADPAGDWGSVIIAFRGYIQVTGLDGERLVEVDKFFVDSFTPRLEPGELVTEVRIPTPPKRSGGAYIKLERRLGDFAIAGVAVQLTLDERDRIKSVGIGLTSLGPTNLRAVKAEEILTGQIPTDEVVEEAAKAAAAEAKPSTDPLRGSEAYKRAMAAVLTRRAIKAAVSRARGGA
jgi:carbon-monoxide dehydrogenase medium subunit